MTRRSISLAVVALSLLPFSSCTCYREAPEPPSKIAERPKGFSTMVTPRSAPERVEPQVSPAVQAKAPPTVGRTPVPATMPENFPEGVPVPEGSQVLAVQHLANDASNVIFTADGESPQLYSFYKDSMKRTYGEPTQQYQGKDQSFLSFKKGDTIINVSVSKDPRSGKRIVAVMYYDEQRLPFPEF
jgi:hypothetical protein